MAYGAGARALGMGGAFFAVADDASASYWNPAALTLLERKEFTAMQAELFAGAMCKFTRLSDKFSVRFTAQTPPIPVVKVISLPQVYSIPSQELVPDWRFEAEFGPREWAVMVAHA